MRAHRGVVPQEGEVALVSTVVDGQEEAVARGRVEAKMEGKYQERRAVVAVVETAEAALEMEAVLVVGSQVALAKDRDRMPIPAAQSCTL